MKPLTIMYSTLDKMFTMKNPKKKFFSMCPVYVHKYSDVKLIFCLPTKSPKVGVDHLMLQTPFLVT